MNQSNRRSNHNNTSYRDKNCKLTKFLSSTAPTSNDSLRSPGLSGLVLYEKVIKSTVLWYYGGGGVLLIMDYKGEAPPEGGTFFRLEVYKWVGISHVKV